MASNYVARHTVQQTVFTIEGQEYSALDLSPKFFAIGNGINNVIFALRDLLARSPFRLHTELSVILSLFETNHFIGWNATIRKSQFNLVHFILSKMSLSGVNLAFLVQIISVLDMLYQMRLLASLYYHSQ